MEGRRAGHRRDDVFHRHVGGLQASDARAGLEMAKPHLSQEIINGRAYWLSSFLPPDKGASPTAYLLPAYDEYTVAYKDRSAILDPSYARRADSGNGIFNPTMVMDGQVVGTWRRTLKKGSVVIMLSPFTLLKKSEKHAFANAASHYGVFLGLPATLE